NVRFHPGEEKNDPDLAKAFADLADLYVNDAFGAAHRAHASTEGIARHLPAVAGFLLQRELEVLGEALESPERPFTAIIGGAKVKDKIGVIENLLNKVDNLLIGGGLSNTFIKAQGHEVGKSLLEEDKVDLARRLIEQAGEKGVRLLLPVDVLVANRLGLDIGPRTRERFAEVIRLSKLIVWNGPMGVFEREPFDEGTNAVAWALAETEAKTIVGGGDSAAAVEKSGLADRIDHISTGG